MSSCTACGRRGGSDQRGQGFKRCPRCGVEKRLADEYFGGSKPYCKTCSAIFQRERRHELRNGTGLPRGGKQKHLRHCPKCDLWMVPHEQFDRHCTGGYQGRCRQCSKEERQQNRDRERRSENSRSKKLRKEVVAAYGGKCECCKEDNPAFLTIDHVDGGGTKMRNNGETHLYRNLKRSGFPRNGFRLLCYNCNCAKGTVGYCPCSE